CHGVCVLWAGTSCTENAHARAATVALPTVLKRFIVVLLFLLDPSWVESRQALAARQFEAGKLRSPRTAGSPFTLLNRSQRLRGALPARSRAGISLFTTMGSWSSWSI